jgi:hypothetical protein
MCADSRLKTMQVTPLTSVIEEILSKNMKEPGMTVAYTRKVYERTSNSTQGKQRLWICAKQR